MIKRVLFILCFSTAFAVVLPKIQQDGGYTYITAPVNVATDDNYFLTVTHNLIKYLEYDKHVNLDLVAYVKQDADVKELSHLKHILQKIERKLKLQLKNISTIRVKIVELDSWHLLPSWDISVADTRPSAYIAFVINDDFNEIEL